MKEAALYNEAITEDGASSTDAGTFEVAAVCRQAKLQLPIDDGIADGLHHLVIASVRLARKESIHKRNNLAEHRSMYCVELVEE